MTKAPNHIKELKSDPANARRHSLGAGCDSAGPTSTRSRVCHVPATDWTAVVGRSRVSGLFAALPTKSSVARFFATACRTTVICPARPFALRRFLYRRSQIHYLALDERMTRNAEDLEVIQGIRLADTKRHPVVDMQIATMNFMMMRVCHAASFTCLAAIRKGEKTNARPLSAVVAVISPTPARMTFSGDFGTMGGTRAFVPAVIQLGDSCGGLLYPLATAIASKLNSLGLCVVRPLMPCEPASTGAKALASFKSRLRHVEGRAAVNARDGATISVHLMTSNTGLRMTRLGSLTARRGFSLPQLYQMGAA
jgi:hypothetical protein